MGAQYQQTERGFTIIETLLVIAISGLLAMALLGGWTTMINTQRYKDSVKTLQSFIQQQYNLVYNVENARANDGQSCVVTAGTPTKVEGGPSTDVPRGQGPCIFMGRLIHAHDTELDVFAIVGADRDSDTSVNDLASIRSRNPVVMDDVLGLSDNSLVVPWQTRMVRRASEGSSTYNVAIAIVRSPLTGTVHTYSLTTDGVTIPELDDVIRGVNETQPINLCLNPEAAFAGGRMGVVIRERASAQSFVQTISDRAGVC